MCRRSPRVQLKWRKGARAGPCLQCSPAIHAGELALEIAMKTALRLAVGGTAALLGIACADAINPSATTGSLAAFESVPAGFSSASSSFAAQGDLGMPFEPRHGDGLFSDDTAR